MANETVHGIPCFYFQRKLLCEQRFLHILKTTLSSFLKFIFSSEILRGSNRTMDATTLYNYRILHQRREAGGDEATRGQGDVTLRSCEKLIIRHLRQTTNLAFSSFSTPAQIYLEVSQTSPYFLWTIFHLTWFQSNLPLVIKRSYPRIRICHFVLLVQRSSLMNSHSFTLIINFVKTPTTTKATNIKQIYNA